MQDTSLQHSCVVHHLLLSKEMMANKGCRILQMFTTYQISDHTSSTEESSTVNMKIYPTWTKHTTTLLPVGLVSRSMLTSLWKLMFASSIITDILDRAIWQQYIKNIVVLNVVLNLNMLLGCYYPPLPFGKLISLWCIFSFTHLLGEAKDTSQTCPDALIIACSLRASQCECTNIFKICVLYRSMDLEDTLWVNSRTVCSSSPILVTDVQIDLMGTSKSSGSCVMSWWHTHN